MKKIFALLVVLALAIGCFAGCGEDDKEKADANATATAGNSSGDKESGSADGDKEAGDGEKTDVMSFTDIAESFTKLGDGSEINIKVKIGVKPILDETVDEEAMLQQFAGLITKQSNGLYEIALAISGQADSKSAKVAVKFGDKTVSELIAINETVYVNLKSVFDFVGDISGMEIALPVENEYIELASFMEFVGQVSGADEIPGGDLSPDFEFDYGVFEDMEGFEDMTTEDFENFEDFGDLGEIGNGSMAILPGAGLITGNIPQETIEQIEKLITVITTAIPQEKLLLVVTQFSDALTNNGVLSMNEEHISFKLDKSNIKPVSLAIAETIRANGPDFIDYVMKALVASDLFDEETKNQMTDGYDKETVKKDLDEMLDKDTLSQSIDNILKEIGDTHLYITLGATENSATIVFDTFIDGLAGATENTFSQMSLVFEIEAKEKTVTDITAPTKVMTEADLILLEAFFSALG